MLLKEKLTVWRKTLAGENFGKLNSSDKLEEKSLGNGLVLPIFKKKISYVMFERGRML